MQVKTKNRLVIASAGAPRTPARIEAGLDKSYRDTENVIQPVNAIYGAKFEKDEKVVIIGGGKTALDSLMYVLSVAKVPGERVYMVIPSDIYYWCRDTLFQQGYYHELVEEMVTKYC